MGNKSEQIHFVEFWFHGHVITVVWFIWRNEWLNELKHKKKKGKKWCFVVMNHLMDRSLSAFSHMFCSQTWDIISCINIPLCFTFLANNECFIDYLPYYPNEYRRITVTTCIKESFSVNCMDKMQVLFPPKACVAVCWS